MKIVQLKASNVKRLVAVEITPEGHLVVIGGKNAAGKTSVLDAIEYALAGKGSLPPQPLRRGSQKGGVVVDLGSIIVRRTFTESGGGSLVVENQEGMRYPSPQAVLDELTGKLTFDPLAFMQRPPREQLTELQRLTGVNLSDLDAQREEVIEERRRNVSRRERTEHEMALMAPAANDTPEEEVSVVQLLAERDAATKLREENQDCARRLDKGKHELGVHQGALRSQETELEDARKEVTSIERQVEQRQIVCEAAESMVHRLTKEIQEQEDDGLRHIDQRLGELEHTNAAVRSAKARREKEAERRELLEEHKKKGRELKALEGLRRDRIGEAEMPVNGLGFGQAGVTFDGLPFEQSSFAQKLRVSVAMGIATNPKLRVMLIRDGSALDEENLALLAEMVKDADCQLWLERVGDDARAQVIIEDGRVKGAELDDGGLGDSGGASPADTAGGVSESSPAMAAEGERAAGGAEEGQRSAEEAATKQEAATGDDQATQS